MRTAFDAYQEIHEAISLHMRREVPVRNVARLIR